MNLEAIKEMYNVLDKQTKEIEEKIKEVQKDKLQLLEDSVEKIESFFDDVLDNINGYISVEIELNGEIFNIQLNNSNDKYATIACKDIRFNILNSNGFGTIYYKGRDRSFEDIKHVYGLINQRTNGVKTYAVSIIEKISANFKLIENEIEKAIMRAISEQYKNNMTKLKDEISFIENVQQIFDK